jgi:hypothetical protein
MKSEFGPNILGHSSAQEMQGCDYTSKLSKALDMARKFHKLRRRLAMELADLTAMAQERGLGADASILNTLHTATLLTRTKFIRQDLDALALSAAPRAE